MKNLGPVTLLTVSIGLCGSVHAAMLVDSNFDQIAKIRSLDGSVSQIGGSGDGNMLESAGDFVGSVTDSTGVSVSLPQWLFLDNAVYDNGLNEPGNFGPITEGAPTDLTFTLPGSGGPDADAHGAAFGDGDGSLKIKSGETLTGSFGGPITTPTGITNDLFIFTDTAGGGKVLVELFSGSTLVDSIDWLLLAASSAGTGSGGAILDLIDGITFDTIVLTGRYDSVEIDGVAVNVVPIPAAVWLFASGLIVLLAASRRVKAAA